MYTLPENVTLERMERIGRFTIAQLRDEHGIKGTGVSRCSFVDETNENLGDAKAFGRALCALKRKQNKELIHNAFMG